MGKSAFHKPIKPFHWIILATGLIVLFLLNISLGSISIPIADTLSILFGTDTHPIWTDIVLDFRLTKAVTCILAGSALSLGGLFMQTLFRNPLAGPDVFGLSSGASLFVALLYMTGYSAGFLFSGSFALAIAASIGSGAVFLLIFLISLRIRENASLLLIGLMIGAATSSVVSVLQFISRTENQHYYLIWTFGSLNALDWVEIALLATVLICGFIIGLFSLKALNAWLLGDNYARSLGIPIQRSRLFIIIATCILTGGVTAFCGPIAFVGIAVPHLARMTFKSTNHKVLIPATILIGSGMMLFCDILAQLPGSARIIPINAITALLGAPVVIWVIVRSKKIMI